MCTGIRPCLHDQIKHTLFAQIRSELLHTDQEFEQLKEVLFAQIRPKLPHKDREFEQLKWVLFARVNLA